MVSPSIWHWAKQTGTGRSATDADAEAAAA